MTKLFVFMAHANWALKYHNSSEITGGAQLFFKTVFVKKSYGNSYYNLLIVCYYFRN